MKDSDIQKLLQYFVSTMGEKQVKLVETHISWVILMPDWVYKIKKPLKYTFLDFSTLALRKYYCERELVLNQRLTEGMYISVEPVYRSDDRIRIGKGGGVVIDYAVKMKRKDDTRQMNLMLKKGKVTRAHIDQITDVLARFHASATIHEPVPDIEAMKADFEDILKVRGLLTEQLGKETRIILENAVALSNRFLDLHADRILERHQQGYTIDGHGDLHSKNILLLDPPVIFDCIEFSDHLRKGDVLNEIAFFCMDLDFYSASGLESYFVETYNQKHPCIFNEKDRNLLLYFKFYRANVRVKVNALKKADAADPVETKKRHDLIEAYFKLLKNYLETLQKAMRKASGWN